LNHSRRPRALRVTTRPLVRIGQIPGQFSVHGGTVAFLRRLVSRHSGVGAAAAVGSQRFVQIGRTGAINGPLLMICRACFAGVSAKRDEETSVPGLVSPSDRLGHLSPSLPNPAASAHHGQGLTAWARKNRCRPVAELFAGTPALVTMANTLQERLFPGPQNWLRRQQFRRPKGFFAVFDGMLIEP
jgi:hypothetical protein